MPFHNRLIEGPHQINPLHSDGAAPSQAASRFNLLRHLGKQFRTGVRVRVNEHQPIPGSRCRAAVPCPGNLIDRLEDHPGASGTRQLSRAVGRVVVADNEFTAPRAACEGGHSGAHLAQRLANEPLLVERGDDDRNFHCAGSGAGVSPARRASRPRSLRRGREATGGRQDACPTTWLPEQLCEILTDAGPRLEGECPRESKHPGVQGSRGRSPSRSRRLLLGTRCRWLCRDDRRRRCCTLRFQECEHVTVQAPRE